MTLHLTDEDARLLRSILVDFCDTFEDTDEESDRVELAARLAGELLDLAQ